MATETTVTSATAWSPDVTAVAPDIAVPDALILATSTVAGTVEGDAPPSASSTSTTPAPGSSPKAPPSPRPTPHSVRCWSTPAKSPS